MKINNKLIKGVIFDLDGTLIDSCSIWKDVDKDFFKKRNMIEPLDYSEEIGHMGLDKAATYTINRFNLKESKEDIIKEWKDGVLKRYRTEVKLKPHVKEFLTLLKSYQIPLCVATANDEDCYKACLINNGIYDFFDFILEVGQFKDGKDKPTIYLEALKRLNIDKEACLVVEDLPMAIATAKNAGFVTIAVYEKFYKNVDEEEKMKNAFLYIKDFNEVINRIKD